MPSLDDLRKMSTSPPDGADLLPFLDMSEVGNSPVKRGTLEELVQAGAASDPEAFREAVGGLSFLNVRDYGAVGDGVVDDTAAVQAAITAAEAVNGTVFLPKGYYKLTDELLIATESITFRGEGAYPEYGDQSVDGDTSVFPKEAPYITGSVLVQHGAGKHGIKITSVGRGVNLRGFGIIFADSIKFVDTGHGVYIRPPVNGSDLRTGLYGYWENVCVYGHDGDHYAFEIWNSQLMDFMGLQGWGGGGLHWAKDGGFCGNSNFYGPYFCTLVGGTANGYLIEDSNYLNFIRPQSFFLHTFLPANPPTTAQWNWYMNDGNEGYSVWAADMEASGGVDYCAGTRLPTNPLQGTFHVAGVTGGINTLGETMIGSWLRAGQIRSAGAGSMFRFDDRTTPTDYWAWYSNAGTARLFSSLSGDKWTVSTSGLLTLPGVTSTEDIAADFGADSARVIGIGSGDWNVGKTGYLRFGSNDAVQLSCTFGNPLDVKSYHGTTITNNVGEVARIGLTAASKDVRFNGAVNVIEQASEPAAPATNGVVIFAIDNGAGKTVLKARFATGATQQLAIEP